VIMRIGATNWLGVLIWGGVAVKAWKRGSVEALQWEEYWGHEACPQNG